MRLFLVFKLNIFQDIKCNESCKCCCDKSDRKQVCACHRDGIKRYTNACAAKCAGAKRVFKCPRQCGLHYSPVCGSDDQTYHNACLAKSAGVDIECRRKCPCYEIYTRNSTDVGWGERSAESIEDWRRK